MNELVLAREAQFDLRDIADYIAWDRRGLRSAVHHGCQTIYRFEGERVEIVRVMHGSRDIPSLL